MRRKNKKIKKISYLRYKEDITEIPYSNIDVFVELEDNSTFTVVLATPKNLEYLMDYDKMNYLEIGDPIIVVKKLTKAVIVETIKAYASKRDGYWLKLHHFAANIDPTIFKKLQDEKNEFYKIDEDKDFELTESEEDELYEVYRNKELDNF